MSTTIDQRIVEMRFDNKQFEQNVSTTMSSLDKLKQKLNLDGAAKGLEGINAAAKNVDMAGLGDSVEKVGLKFSGLWTIADQALRNITNSVMNTGKKIVSSLTIDPIKTGFSEYETQIKAIQTILANTESKGTTLNDVNKALDELNTYADKTIYNFTEMTRNIGTFTAAGVDLDTSVAAIKGIANLAAVSGSTSQQASTAMYQLSQALSSGTVRLMDWNSVVNAGMGGQVFQDALKETARVHGIAIDDLIKQEGSFRESLSKGWLSSEILTETLAKFTGDLNAEQLKTMGYTEEQIEGILKMGQTANDAATKVKTLSQLRETLMEAAQSGWAQSWEIIVGDFEEAKVLFTQVSDTLGGLIGKSAASRNDLLENWKVLGGRTAVIDALKHSFDAVMSIVQAVSEAMNEVFPPLTAEKLVAFCVGLKELAQRFAEVFKVNGKATPTFNNLKRTLKGVFAIVDIVRQVFAAFAKVVGKVLGVTGKLGGGLLEVTARMGDWLVSFRDALEHSKVFEQIVSALGRAIDFVAEVATDFGRIVTESFIFKAASEGLRKFVELIATSRDKTKALAESATTVKNTWENSGVYKVLMSIWGIVKAVGSGAKKIFDNLFGGISEAFGRGDWNVVFDIIGSILSGGLIVGLISLVKKIKDLIDGPGSILEALEGSINKFGDIFDKLGGVFGSFQNRVNAEALKGIATAIAILVASLVVLTLLDEEKLSSAMAALTIVMTMITLMMMIMTKGKKLGKIDVDMVKVTSSLVTMSTALLIAAAAFAILGSMDMAGIGKGILGMLGVMSILVAAQVVLGRFVSDSSGLKKGANAMRSMAVTLLLMCAPLAIIGSTEWGTIIKGLTGITAVITLLTAAAVICDRFTGWDSMKGAAAMVVMAIAITMLVPPLLLIGAMPIENLLKAGIGLIAILGTMVGVQVLYSKLGTGVGDMMAGAAAIAIMAVAISQLIPMLATLGLMSWGALLRSIVGLVAILGTMVGVQVLYSQLGAGAGKMMAGAAAIAIMAMAINALLPTFVSLSLMSWPGLLKAGAGLVGVLAAVSAALIVLSKVGGGGGAIAAAVAIGIMSGAMIGLATALLVIGSLNPTKLVAGLLSLTAALAVLVGVAYLITPVIASLLAFAGAVAAIGVGMLAAGTGLVLFGLGLSAIAAGIVALVGAITVLAGSLPLIAKALITLIASVIEGAVRGMGAGIVALCEVLIESLPLLAQVCIELIGALCDVVVACAPKIVDTLLVLVLKICESFAKFVPPIAAAVVRLIAGVIAALAQELPGLIKACVDLLFAFVEGVINALGGMNPDGLLQALKNVGMLAGIMAALAAMALLAPAAMVGVVAMGLVVAKLSVVLAALGAFGSIPGLQDMIGKGGNLLQAVGTAIGQFVGGLVGGFAKGATADLPEIASNLSGFADNIGGFVNIAPSLADSLKSLAGASIATSIADFFNFGGGAMDVFTKELPALGVALAGFSTATATINPEQVKGVASAAESIAEMTSHIPNSGGMVSWITGDNSIAKFGIELGMLGMGIKAFSTSTAGINPEQVKAAASAAQTIAEMTNHIPNSGGIVSWFTGDNSIAKFSAELGLLGVGLKAFAVATTGIVPEQVTAAASAAKTIAEMTNNIPNSGGMASWFAGENSIANFSIELGSLGAGISSFAKKTSDVDPEQVKAAASAAKAIAEMTQYIPNSDGIAQWFTGETAISKFSDQLPALGNGIAGFADSIGDAEIAAIGPAATAAKALAEMTQYIPNEGGVKAWFTGETAISKFATQLPKLGAGILGFSQSINGMNPTNVDAAATAAKKLAEMTDTVPKNSNKIVTFGDNLGKFGTKMKSFITATAGISTDSTKGANVLVTLAKEAATIDSGKIKGVATALKELTKAAENMEKDIKASMKEAGKKAIEGYIDGMNAKLPDAKTAISDLIDKVADKASDKARAFEAAGKACVTGFARGIRNNKYLATGAGSEVGTAALEAAKEAVDSNSPSKEFMKLGRDSDIGFANGLTRYADLVYDSGYDVGRTGLNGLGDSISKISRLVENGIDSQPQIRPVLDLSDVENGVGRIGGIFANTPLGVRANLGAITSMMGSRAQNGTNKDVTDAIKELRSDINKIKTNVYNINGITYDDGTNIADAVSTLIRAAKMERRV